MFLTLNQTLHTAPVSVGLSSFALGEGAMCTFNFAVHASSAHKQVGAISCSDCRKMGERRQDLFPTRNRGRDDQSRRKHDFPSSRQEIKIILSHLLLVYTK